MKAEIARIAVLGFLLLAPIALADDGPDKDKAQYEALGKSRADAELAVRQAHKFFDDGEKTWRTVSAEIESARSVADDALLKVVNDEQRKGEDVRDQKTIDAAEQKRADLATRWQQYGATARPGLEADFHDADNQAAATAQLLHALEAVEGQLKETHSDLAPLAALYDETSASATSSVEKGTDTLDSLKKIDQTWEATTRPAAN